MTTTTIAAEMTETGARLLLGKPVAAAITEEVRAGVAEFIGQYDYVPALAVLTVDPTREADRYTETLRKQSAAVGLAFERRDLPANTDAETLRNTLVELNHRPQIAGV